MPTGLFDELIAADEARDSQQPGTTGLFDELIDRDEGTTHTGKYYPPEERKGVTYQGQYIPSMYEMEKGRETRIREALPKGAFQRFREGATEGLFKGLEGADVLTAPDDKLKSLLLAQQEKMMAASGEPEPSFIEKGAGMAGELAGTGAGAIISQVGLKRAGVSGFFGASSARDAFYHAGLRALARNKTPEEAVQIAKKVSRAGAAIGAVEGAVLPTGGMGSVKQVAKQAGFGGVIGGAGQVARNVSERVAGLKTPILENVPQAVGMMAGIPVLFGGAGGVYRALTRKGAPIPPAPAPVPAEVVPPSAKPKPPTPTAEGPIIDIETIVNPSKPLEPPHVKMIEDGIGKAISENKPPGEAPGLIAGTSLEKWADDVMSAEFRGRLSINPVDLLAKEIPALAIKGAAVIERGVRDYPAWSAEMTKLYGDEFKPILRKVYMQSLQVKGAATPNALQRETTQTVQPLRQEPQASQEQVPVQARLPEAISRREPAVQPREVGQSQVPLIERPVQEVAANYGNLLGEIESYGVENFNRALGAKAKTPEDIAALKTMAESHSARISQLKKDGNFPEAMRLSGFQPMEAYRFATEKGQPASRGIAASARDALASDVPRGTEAGFVRLPEQFKQAVEAEQGSQAWHPCPRMVQMT